ncbi:MAG: glycosyltransferase [Candidatus Hodarchaeales archaeon]
MINLLSITSTFPRNKQDSWGNFILELLQELGKKYVRVFALTQRYRNDKQEEKFQNISVIRFPWLCPANFIRIADFKRTPIVRLMTYFFFAMSSIHKLIKKEKIQIIHANWIIPAGFIGIIAKMIYKRPLIITIRGSDVNIWAKKRILSPLIKFILKHCDAIIVVSNELSKEIVKLGIEPQKIHIIWHGVYQKNNNHRNIDKKSLLFVGALREVKGLKYLIRAINIVKEHYPNVKLNIVGEGTLHNYIVKELIKLNLTSHVKLLGKLPNSRVIELMAESGIFILPSISEGLPRAIIEAMTQKLPVIATAVGGNIEIIEPGVTGILVPPKEEKELSKAILNLIKNPDFSKMLAENALQFVSKNFNWKNTVMKYYDVFRLITNP